MKKYVYVDLLWGKNMIRNLLCAVNFYHRAVNEAKQMKFEVSQVNFTYIER